MENHGTHRRNPLQSSFAYLFLRRLTQAQDFQVAMKFELSLSRVRSADIDLYYVLTLKYIPYLLVTLNYRITYVNSSGIVLSIVRFLAL